MAFPSTYGRSDDDDCSGNDDIFLTTNTDRDEDTRSTARAMDDATRVSGPKKDQNWTMADPSFYGLSNDDEPLTDEKILLISNPDQMKASCPP